MKLSIFMEDTRAGEGFVICRIEESYPLSDKERPVGLREFLKRV